MRTPSIQVMKDVIGALKKIEKEADRKLRPWPPTMAEVGRVAGRDSSTVFWVYRELERTKFVSYVPGSPRSLVVLKPLAPYFRLVRGVK